MARVSQGVLVIVGGFLIHLVLGTLYMWGNINVYVRSYFCFYGNYGISEDSQSCAGCTLSQGTVQIIFPLMFQALTISMPFGLPTAQKLGFKVWCFIGAILLPGGILASSWMKNFWAFASLYGILFGLVAGALYMIPFNLGQKYFPNNKGTVSGIIASGFGLGSIIFSEIVYEIVNPHNHKADEGGCYPKDVASEFPKSLRYLSLIYFVLMAVGGILQMVPSNMVEEELKEIEDLQREQGAAADTQDGQQVVCPDKKTGFKQPKLYVTALLAFFLSCVGILISSNYKPYGILYGELNDDKYLTWVGNAGSIMNAVSRLFWGFMMDFLDFRYIVLILSFFQMIVTGAISFTTSSETLYIIFVILSYAMYGGLYAIFPTQMARMFGRNVGLVVIAAIFQGFSTASWAQFLIVKYYVNSTNIDDKQTEYNIVYHAYIIAPICAFLMGLLINYKIDWVSKLGNIPLLAQDDGGEKSQHIESFDDDDDFNPENRESLEFRGLDSNIQRNNPIKQRLTKKQERVLEDSSYISNPNGTVGGNYPGYKR